MGGGSWNFWGATGGRGAAKAVAVATILNRNDDGANWLDRQTEVGDCFFFFGGLLLLFKYLNQLIG